MKRLIAWFAENAVAANLLMLAIVVSGVVTTLSIKKEFFPEFSLDMISVSVPYPGAAPTEVEDGVITKIEDAVQGLEGIEEIRATASENVGTVMVEVRDGENVREVLDDVKSRIDAIDTFPEEAEEPVIREVTNRTQVINLAVHGPASERTIKEIADRVRDDLAALDGITLVEVDNARPYEISVEISEKDLRRHGLTFEQVANAVRRSSLDLPGGTVETEGGEVLLRTEGQAYRGDEFERLVLLTGAEGTRIPLGAVANVVDGFADTDQKSRFNGERSINLQVFRIGEQSALDVAAKVRGYARDARGWLPEGIELTPWNDRSRALRDRLSLLIKNGLLGGVLVVMLLTLFLRFRVSIWVSMGIPISFLGALWLIPSMDVSINMISLFAFIVSLGIVVDDAIVAGENIHTHRSRGKRPLEAAIDGAHEISTPIIFAVLTTIAAFGPILAVPGSTGKIMRVIPIVVILTLLFSLVESLLILPAHLRKLPPGDPEQARTYPVRAWRRFQKRFADALRWFIDRAYRPSLELGLRLRYAVLALAVSTAMVTVGLFFGGYVKFTFFPSVEADFVSVALTMPQGTPVSMTERAVSRLESAAHAVEEELERQGRMGDGGIYANVVTSIGDQPLSELRSRAGGGTAENASGSHIGEVAIELTPAEERAVSSGEIAAMWRENAGAIPDAQEVSFNSTIFDPGDDINVQLAGKDSESLAQAAERLKHKLREYPGVFEIADSYEPGKREIELHIKPRAETLGLTLSDLARQVRHAFYGAEAQRIQRGRHEVKVMVRFPEEDRRSLAELENMRIRTADGAAVPFRTVASVRHGRGYASIDRVDRFRVVNVTGSVDDDEANANEILADLEASFLPRLLADHQGLRYSLEGEQAEQRDTLGGLRRGFMIALVAIYALLAVPFRSYVQPFIVMGAIPFGVCGAIWGHIIMGYDLSILSMFGVVALTGVVVNDSLVMVDFVNRNRASGMPLMDAVREAGAARFRPILLTSLTTFAGLTPLLLERSLQAKFLIPMAISLGFGVIFATFITLVLVPASYMVLEDVKRGVMRVVGREGQPREPGEAGQPA
jgi:multidrug efflux pump subunit AcrB